MTNEERLLRSPMSGYYILDTDGNPQRCSDATVWGQWFETAERHVARDMDEGDESHGIGTHVVVSTVFLGRDHQWGDGPPILWETMVFGGPLDGEQERYASREDALRGHQAMCARMRAAANVE